MILLDLMAVDPPAHDLDVWVVFLEPFGEVKLVEP